MIPTPAGAVGPAKIDRCRPAMYCSPLKLLVAIDSGGDRFRWQSNPVAIDSGSARL
jgi:hypothetical protein